MVVTMTTKRMLWVVVAALAACGRNEYAPPPPPEVTVAHPVEQTVTTYLEFSGRTEAVEAVDVRARVQGFLQSVNFQPATDVKKGDLLFVIEPNLYEARVEKAEADLASAFSQLKAAEEQLEITQAIFERRAGSRADLVTKTQARDQARAAVSQTRAELEAAKIDLSYTHVYSPIDGRIDRNRVDPGNLVGAAGDQTILATVIRQHPIYAYFQGSERELLEFRARQRRGETVAATGTFNRAFLGLVTEEGFPHEGQVDYVSNRVDPSTGTIEVRAIFPNPDGVLLPGLFARVRLPFTAGEAIVVPESAVGADQGGRYVLVVGKDDVVELRRVTVGALVDGARVIDKGVTPADRVVVNGIQRARPGTKVHPKTA